MTFIVRWARWVLMVVVAVLIAVFAPTAARASVAQHPNESRATPIVGASAAGGRQVSRGVDSANVIGRYAFRGAMTPAADVGALSRRKDRFLATRAAGPRFVVNGAGEALDSTRVTVPSGKYGYLLENPSKSGVFADSMGFTERLSTRLFDNTSLTTSGPRRRRSQ